MPGVTLLMPPAWFGCAYVGKVISTFKVLSALCKIGLARNGHKPKSESYRCCMKVQGQSHLQIPASMLRNFCLTYFINSTFRLFRGRLCVLHRLMFWI